jgi:hypothetical protein
VVQNASPVEREDVCRGALDALEFLSESGYPLDFDLVVELSSQKPVEAYDAGSAGMYRRADRRILILGHDAFFGLETFLGQSCDRALFRSVIAHEIAHAVSDRYFATELPSQRAQEYIAAVVTLATMDTFHLQRLLDDKPLPGFSEESEISLLFYLLSPGGFMVKAYRHFLLPENGAGFLAAVLAGEALRYDEQLY